MWFRSARLLVLALVWLSVPAFAGSVKLQDARLWATDARTRVVLDLSADTQPDIFMLANPNRLVVDLPHTRNLGRVAQNSADSSLIRGVRAGIRHGTDVRVVMDLTQRVQAKSFMLDPDGQHGYRLVVDLYPGDSAAKAPGTRVAERDPEPAKPEPSPDNSDDTAEAAAEILADTHGQKNSATARDVDGPTRAERAQAAGRDIVVAIDAGHGGKDPGAHGPNGLLEKTVTLAIARRLKAMVDDQPHMKGVLTRDRDEYVGLRQRMVIARRDKADFFISIHCDASPRGVSASGASVYALSPHGATSEHARWLARRENASDLVSGVSLKGKNSSLASFVLDLSQSASIDASLDAAKRVLTQLDGLGDLHKSDVQQAGFMVLKSPDIPSILVETNFISNPAEASRLGSARYQQQLASAMLRGIKGYFASYRPSTYITAAQVYRVKPGDTLSEIAERFGVSPAVLKQNNDLDNTRLRVGQELRIDAAQPQQLASRQ
ncbi:N-acetylmuramoyl-L-alanine amidase [Salinisphaera sp. Q1T1-3]|uniref:N-acetylmuramoyl-L-alanine amidase n=1 Tax=Salinisphaera sp. Q1T1-3 TaxID=2321229 RepID=UPI000E71C59D|nr:N-acetylmuramoyl-L-alanine amidase [Salinisphaera sp. Q1T1-3]RJS93788.1 AMIN domain-containing protein [Salinisphaera sp. Q1T1-3]